MKPYPYGHLKKFNNPYGREGGGAEPFTYHYGYPAYGSVEPNVVAQWLFDEASGNIVDEVSSITLTPNSTPVYNQTVSGDFAGLSPGINYNSGADSHVLNGGNATLAIGTNDFVFEFWCSLDSASSTDTSYVFFNSNWSTGEGYYMVFDRNTNILQMSLEASDGTFVSKNFALGATNYDDGNPHKYRLSGVRSGSATLYLDGVLIDSVSLAALSGKSITNNDLAIGGAGGAGTGNFGLLGKLFELRITIGNATNNSGGIGGG